MNKKGITLVELLAALALIAIISMIAVPLTLGVIKDSQGDANTVNKANIKEVAEMYVADNIGSTIDFDVTPTVTVTLKQLVDSGYISGDLKDKVKNKEYNLDTSNVTITKDGNNYNYVVNLNTN